MPELPALTAHYAATASSGAVGEDLARRFATEVAKAGGEALERGIEKARHPHTDEQKCCRVCGKRIKENAKFLFGRRFYCRGCGHRTHVRCAADRRERVCAKCGDEGTWR